MQRKTLIIIIVVLIISIGLGLGLGLGFGLKSDNGHSGQSQTTSYVYVKNTQPKQWDANMCQAYISQCKDNIAKGQISNDALAGCNEYAKAHGCTI